MPVNAEEKETSYAIEEIQAQTVKESENKKSKKNNKKQKIINTTTSEAPGAKNIRSLAWVLSVIRQACAMVCQTA